MSIISATRQVGSVTIVDITDNIVFGEDWALLHSLVSGLLGNGYKWIVFNLSGVDHVDSSGLSYLVSALASVRRTHGELKLLKPTKKVQDTMRLTKLDAVFDILDEEAKAIRSFEQSVATSA
jgi:anti-sigma B factor antagonist